MADPIQGVPGTATTLVIPEATSAPKVRVSEADAQAAAQVGVDAPAPAATNAADLNLELSSAARDVLAVMPKMPPQIDIESVERIKTAIANNEYPIDYDKIATKLFDAVKSLET